MAQAELENAPSTAPEIELEGGTYEIIRNRMTSSGAKLRARLDQLNHSRKEIFGSIDTALLGTERITTQNNCVPRDMVAVGNRFVFGYNVHIGLKSEIELSDVFAVYEFREGSFHELPLDLIGDERFRSDFRDLFRYYKHAVFAKFAVIGPHLFMVCRIGKSVNDIKTFKWLMNDDSLAYMGNRSDHELRFPVQHEFEWKRTHRDLHREGQHPHISIENRVFVETIGGDLTIKIENNTDSGEGIYSEAVENKDQTLDDAEIYYASVGNIVLMRIRPYQEQNFRYIIYNEKLQQARRLDSIEDACVLLPDDHGLIFSNGYYLQTGEHKTFESDLSNMLFERRIAAPNGEDFLYVFYNRMSGIYSLLQYNLIEQKIETPIICNGWTFFAGGELVCFKCHDEPQKHHAIQVWQTPYVGKDYVPHTQSDSFLNKVGNKEIVRGMAECHEVLGLIEKDDTYANLYVDLVKLTGDVMDSYFWIDREETFNLNEVLGEIKGAATSAVDEFEKVVRVKRNTSEQTKDVSNRTREILNAIHHKRFDQIGDFVTSLGDLRAVRGDIISLRDLRYIDETLVESLEADVTEQTESLARRCVEFLLQPASLQPYEEKVVAEKSRIDDLTKVTDAKQLEENIAASASELEMLIDIVSNLKIDDATHRTTIIDNISGIFSNVNQARALLKKKTKDLLSVEGVAEFNSQMKLLNQGVVNYLDICNSPDKCEEFLTKVMIQIEELESRFAEFDEFVIQLTEKRDEVYNAFESRKLALVEARNKRANTLMSAAERILKGIKSRVYSLESINEINGYFASDLMIEKVRDLIDQLKELDDSVKVDDVQSRLKTVKQDAIRQLKDRQELFVDGENVIKFGNHHFSVNVQALDLTSVFRDNELCLHLTGTNFFEAVENEELQSTRDVWDQEVVSENRDVYRGEFLAFHMLNALRDGHESPTFEEACHLDSEELLAAVQRFMAPRYSESYVKGVNDYDAAQILHGLLQMESSIGLLRYHTCSRAMANVYWQSFGDKKHKALVQAKLKGFGTITQLFPDATAQSQYIAELRDMLREFVTESHLFDELLVDEAAEYLFHELTSDKRGFVISQTAANLHRDFNTYLNRHNATNQFAESIKAVHRDPASSVALLRDWVHAFLAHAGVADDSDVADHIDEVAAILLHGKMDTAHVIAATAFQELSGMAGSHPVIDGDNYRLHYNRFMLKLNRYTHEVVPRFNRFVDLKRELVDDAREDLRLEEFRPRVLTSFVRNKLLDTVYLPLIGDNLAKQMGVVGEQKRTDLMGLLLLVSPPGYGKTTLMEYVANRLGIIFMKINGPAIGHHVTSLDPDEAPNAGAREEVEKLNLSLEMGDNVMIYLDDIQHCNPEFLQKFISLCDAQRKIEGVYKGKTRTYDLRGRKVAVVMAGNPYTESGDKFQIPDMLSNRADIYNLGEMIGEHAEAFEMSFLENSLTSNPILNKLASRSQKDVYSIIQMAEHDRREGIELEGNYSIEELNELVATMKKLTRVRDVILTVNREYISSAAQSDDYRVEPAFKLQGSYRNMNRIAEKVVPIMNDQELETLIVSNYENDSQTLTSDTEANMLKFKELIGILNDDEAERWKNIKKTFQQNTKMKGVGSDDKVGQVIVQLSSFSEGLDSIHEALTQGIAQLTADDEDDEKEDEPSPFETSVTELIAQVGELQGGLESIGGAVTGGLSKVAELAEAASTRPVQIVQPPAPTTPAPRPISVQTDDTEATSETTSAGTQKITIVNKIPPTLVNVLRHQFKLMNGWMEPIYSATNAQSAEIQQLKELLTTCLEDYAKLIERVEKTRGRSK